MALTKEAQKTVNPSPFETDSDFIELSDEELRALIDAQARKFLHISGEEFLRRRRERKPIEDDLGQPVPAWGPLSSLAWLLDD